MDADLSHDPIEIPIIIDLLNKHEFVIGSRYMDGGKCEMQALRLECNEFTSSYRGFNLKKLKNFNLNIVKSKGYSFFMESIFRITQKGYKIHQIPITFKNRTKGKSKIPKIEILRTIKNLLILKFIE
jgi:dolichol-phosphate mannosyltransferase